eukprot:2189249-Alexandrium_andersonii.AAC.1
MSASLVGSEMCIRDSCRPPDPPLLSLPPDILNWRLRRAPQMPVEGSWSCLLYTSDAADDM